MSVVERPDIDLTWIVSTDATWITPHLLRGDRTIVDPDIPHGSEDLRRSLDNHDLSGTLRLLCPPVSPAQDPRLPRAPKEFASAGIDVVHFLTQDAFLVDAPSIYHPHDLQHARFPQFFSVEELGWRELAWRTFANEASLIAVAAEHVSEDIAWAWPEVAEKCRVIPLFDVGAPSRDMRAVDISDFTAKVGARSILLYPAGAWPHKNHVRLVEAFGRVLRERNDVVLVLTGFELNDFAELRSALDYLGLGCSVLCAGRLTDSELDAVYARAMGVLLPSLFEAGSFPLVEAVTRGLRVALSDINGHRFVNPHGVEWFDPTDVSSITDAINSLVSQGENCPAPTLGITIERGTHVVAQRFVDVYRELGTLKSQSTGLGGTVNR
jgi:glycosyltransferase involved in cell wall biosynthesis